MENGDGWKWQISGMKSKINNSSIVEYDLWRNTGPKCTSVAGDNQKVTK